MTVQLSRKETMLLQDQKKHEEVCVAKYNTYARQAQDPNLKQLFSNYAQQEQQHLETINQILAGHVPQVTQNSGQGQQILGKNLKGANNSHDAGLCSDMLMTEKYISNTYDTAIFETRDSNIRQVLNHIQKEEQEHGEGIFNYMKNSGMYETDN
ncbi:MAG: spore coat protein [Firmicutes bacterium]|nr:spore coat protein [Bacillota bacterium]